MRRLGLLLTLLIAIAVPVGGDVVSTSSSTSSGGGGAVTVTDTVDTAQVTATGGGSLQVECISGCGGSGGASTADGASHVAGTTQGTAAQGVFDDAAPGTLAEDKVGTIRATASRAWHVNLRNASGTEVSFLTDTQLRASAVPVSLASVPSHAVTNAGTFATQSAATQSGTWTVQPGNTPNTSPWLASIHDGTTKAAVFNLAANDPLSVAIVDGSGNQITSFGGTGGTAAVDNAAFTPGTTNFTPIGGEVDDAATTAATENSAAAARMTVQRALHVNLRDNSGAELAVGGGTQYDEDTVSSAADKLNMAGVVRKDTAATLVGTDGDRTQLQVNAAGRLWTDGSGVTQPVSGTVTANAGTGTFTVGDGAGALNTIVDSSALPAGASTLAEQQTQTTSLAAHTTALQIIDNLPNTIGSTTAGSSGAVALGAVTTSAPTYTTAQNHPLSLSTAGGLRVEVAAVTAVGDLDGSVVTPDVSEVTLVAGCVTGTSVGAADRGCVKILTDRRAVVVGGDAAGSPTAGQVLTVQGIASATPVIVGDGTGALNTIVDSGTITANAGTGTFTVGDGAGALNVIVDSSALPSGAATSAEQATQTASLSVLDDWDESDRAKANIIVGQAGITAGAGAVAANTPRMTHASDDPLVTLLTTLTTVATGLKYNSVGTTEDEHAVKATAGTLWSITTTNTNAAVRYLRCANAVAGSTTPGTTTPVIDLAIPGAAAGAGFTTSFPKGFAFATALTCWFVTGAADTDVAEVAANEIKVLYTLN